MIDKEFWEKYFLTYDILNEAIPYQKLLGELIKILEVKEGDLILDAGSGTGNLCILLKKYGARPIGYDFSKKAIEIHLTKDKDAEVHFGDLTYKLPFTDNYFDNIVSNNVIYTIDKDDRLAVFKEFYRVLKINGKCVIANVHTGFNPLIILQDLLIESVKIRGISKTATDLIAKSCGIGKMIYYSFLITTKYKSGKCAFFEKDEQKELLMKAGFRNIADTINAYSNQSYIDIGVK